jgi:hypothetical protein
MDPWKLIFKVLKNAIDYNKQSKWSFIIFCSTQQWHPLTNLFKTELGAQNVDTLIWHKLQTNPFVSPGPKFRSDFVKKIINYINYFRNV